MTKRIKDILLIASALLMAMCPLSAFAEVPLIAIILDDLGNQKLAGERAIALPGPVVCSIMPHTAYSNYLAEQAHAAGKEVMLHLPMQGMDMQRPAAPGEISLDTSRANLERILAADLEHVPHAAGINNHMGSLITRHPGHMTWLMAALEARGDLFFVDSYTTASSVAYETALSNGIPAARRDIFLDNPDSTTTIASEFERLKAEARQRGYAIAIGHPYPATLAYLEKELPMLESQGFKLVPVSRLVRTLPVGAPAPLQAADPPSGPVVTESI